MKLLKIPKDEVCIVGYFHQSYDQFMVLAVFKTKESAERFINECKEIEKAGNKLKFKNKLGKTVSLFGDDKYARARDLRVLEQEAYEFYFPFFNK